MNCSSSPSSSSYSSASSYSLFSNPSPLKNFHSHSASIPLDIPSQPGCTIQHEIPFGPPVFHVDPERTLPMFPQHPLLSGMNQSFFFNPKERCVAPFPEDEMNDEDMKDDGDVLGNDPFLLHFEKEE